MYLGSAGLVRADLRHLRETAGQALQKLRVKKVPRRCQAIVTPQPRFTNGDKTRATQVGQVPGYLRLFDSQDFDDVADATFAATQQIKHAETRAVRESSEHPIGKIGGGR
jgi:hypothetical protein